MLSSALASITSTSAAVFMSMERVVVVGGGVIGLSVARAITRAKKSIEVFVLEKEQRAGTSTTSRNSGVIHAGLYYNPNSLKNDLCLKGKKRLISYLQERSLPLNVCGKLVVATSPEEHSKLDAIATRCKSNGLEGLQVLTSNEVTSLYESHVSCK